MCLAVPGKIISIDGENAIVGYDGIKRKANVAFVDVKKGDYILVHVGFAIQKIDEEKAKESLGVLREMVNIEQ